MPTPVELRDQRKRAHNDAVAALSRNDKASFERAMADVDRLGNELSALETRSNARADAEERAAYIRWMRGRIRQSHRS